MAVALSAYEKFDEVPLSVLEWCYNLVKRSSLNFLQLFEEKASQTQYEELKQKALTWFRSQNNKTQYHTLSELARNARLASGKDQSPVVLINTKETMTKPKCYVYPDKLIQISFVLLCTDIKQSTVSK